MVPKRVCAKKGCSNTVPKFYITADGKKHNCQTIVQINVED